MQEDAKSPWELVHQSSPAEDDGTTTYRMRVDGGWLYRVATRHSNASRIVTACAEALTFVPNKPPSTKR